MKAAMPNEQLRFQYLRALPVESSILGPPFLFFLLLADPSPLCCALGSCATSLLLSACTLAANETGVPMGLAGGPHRGGVEALGPAGPAGAAAWRAGASYAEA